LALAPIGWSSVVARLSSASITPLIEAGLHKPRRTQNTPRLSRQASDRKRTDVVVSFLLNVDTRIYNELTAEAERRDLKIEKVVRGYIALCFKQCLADEEVKEAA
jgi:hypothetical protein